MALFRKTVTRRSALIGLSLAAGLVAAVSTTGPAFSQAADWPSRPVTIVVPYGPGASNDIFARMLATILQKKFNQPFVVENRPGGAGFVGTNVVARATPDGYTLLEHNETIASLGIALNNGFVATKDLAPLAMLSSSPLGVMVPSTINVSNVKEFVDYAKKNPETTFYAIGAFGGSRHLAHAKLGIETQTQLKPVSYKSGAEMFIDLAAGRIQLLFGSTTSAATALQDNKVKVIAYTGPGALPEAPKAPILKDLGIDLEVLNWFGIFGPAGMAPELQAKINKAINEAIVDPEFAALMKQSQALPTPISIAEFTSTVDKETKSVEDMVKKTGIKPQQ